ncbi:MAG TPA: chemotaxis protein CheB [Herpetosiphonaceae bacterium]
MAFAFVALGASLGGLRALREVLGGLPADFCTPIGVVLHRHKEALELADIIGRATALPVVEVADKTPLGAGRIYLAPADYHMMVEQGHFALATDAPVSYARPSIDVFFRSVAETFAAQAVGVLLTGANHDGAEGLALIRTYGGCAVVQDPAGAEAPAMPSAALAAGPVDHVLPLARIAPLLIELCPSMPR